MVGILQYPGMQVTKYVLRLGMFESRFKTMNLVNWFRIALMTLTMRYLRYWTNVVSIRIAYCPRKLSLMTQNRIHQIIITAMKAMNLEFLMEFLMKMSLH